MSSVIAREQFTEERRTQAQVLESTDGAFRFEAVVSEADFLNRNRRIYPEGVLFPAFERLNDRLAENPGLVDHPAFGPSSVSDIGIRWEGFAFEGKAVIGRGRIVPTQKGRDLQAAIEAGVAVGFSTRGYGAAEEVEHEDGRKARRMVEFDLDTVDAVVDPSVRHARTRHFTKEETEQMEQELKQAQEALEAANARIAELEAQVTELKAANETAPATALAEELVEAESKLSAAEARIQELEGIVAEGEKAKAEATLESKLFELTSEHRFGAAIRAEVAALRESGIPVTLENIETLVSRFQALVEAAGSTANDAAPRGSIESDEDEAPKTESARDRLTPQQLEELAAMGL
jgi:hypothetical protein